ncbi:MAG: hypothetical protein EZS28_007714 [Streblomastix strix]|uniref:Uncharacterized protein n=1 Tax=Streblomastix strix TaxID=222440 RepID=A0A5J4WPA4_9EUKA|nr:MAG: hypothetical protein EZS28_007714 [Streblomastix strix]
MVYIQQTFSDSTWSTYKTQIKVWIDWCNHNKVSLLTACAGDLADSMNNGFSNGEKKSSIFNMHSAVSIVIGLATGRRLGSNAALPYDILRAIVATLLIAKHALRFEQMIINQESNIKSILHQTDNSAEYEFPTIASVSADAISFPTLKPLLCWVKKNGEESKTDETEELTGNSSLRPREAINLPLKMKDYVVDHTYLSHPS